MQENWQKRLRGRQKSAILSNKACPAARFGVRVDRFLAGTVPAVWKNSDEGGEQYAGDPSTALFRFHFFRAQSSFPIQEALPLTTAMPLFLG